MIGSELIGQSFVDAETGNTLPGYFRGRPSAAGRRVRRRALVRLELRPDQPGADRPRRGRRRHHPRGERARGRCRDPGRSGDRVRQRLGIRNPYLTIAGQTAPGKGICIANYNMGAMGCARPHHPLHARAARQHQRRHARRHGHGLQHPLPSTTTAASPGRTTRRSAPAAPATSRSSARSSARPSTSPAIASTRTASSTATPRSIGGDIGSFHHNLLAHCSGRNWSLAGGLDQATRHAGRLDIRNNVVYNWGHRTTDGGAKEVKFVNNYYKPGPASDVFHVLMAEREAVDAFGPQMYYVAGNVMEGRFGADEPLAGVFERRREPHEDWIVAEPFYESFVTTQTAEEAYDERAGRRRLQRPVRSTSTTSRVIDETRNGTTTYKGSVSGLPGLPDTQDDVGGWDEYPEVHRPADWDPDNDGMPSTWETEHGLDPANPADANARRERRRLHESRGVSEQPGPLTEHDIPHDHAGHRIATPKALHNPAQGWSPQ